MNNKRRDSLNLAIDLLEQTSYHVSRAFDSEQECLDNMPENLQLSENYEKMEAAIEYLDAAIENIDTAKDNLRQASL